MLLKASGRKAEMTKPGFLNISQGSLEECRYYLILAQDLKYGESQSLMMQLEEVSKLLEGYTRAIIANSY
jgi:four helix bundle protein